MPWDSWGATMMASAIRDPLYQAALTVANQDVLGIGQWCLRCHSPTSYVQGHGLPTDGSALDAVDRAGVSCEACHRTRTDAGLIGNAQLTFEPSFTVFGPYTHVDSPAHTGVQDPAVSQSSLCGQCHEVRNPVLGRAGTRRPFPLDTTYSEWLHSAYSTGAGAKTCQGCHMVRETEDLPLAKQGPVRPTPSRHAFVGGNVWGLDAVRAAAAPGDLDGLDAAFAANRAAALQNLAAAADVQVLLPDGPLPVDTDVLVKVRVLNRTGHKLPTGYADGRRVFLELRVNDQVVSGAYDGDAGALVSDPQLAVFEAVHGRSDGGRTISRCTTPSSRTPASSRSASCPTRTPPRWASASCATRTAAPSGRRSGRTACAFPGPRSPGAPARWRPACSTRRRPASMSRLWPPPTSPMGRATGSTPSGRRRGAPRRS